MTITKKGYELAGVLRLPITAGKQHIFTLACSRLSRLAKSYATIQERWCCEEMSPKEVERTERAETLIETNVRKHCKTITEISGVTVEPLFNGDPRGSVIKLTLPNGYRHLYDCAGKEGVCVP